MSEARVVVECGGCNRILTIPAAWGVVAYLCVACRAHLAPVARRGT